MAERILVIEDEPLVRDLVVLNLQHAGYAAEGVGLCADGLRLLAAQPPALAIVDIMLPDGDGFTLTRKARDLGVSCPILLLTARDDTPAKVRGLDCGADDYLTKPFDVLELLARVRALLRRAAGEAPPAVKLSFDRYWVRFDTGQALTNAGEQLLSEPELRLVELFSRHENRGLTRSDIVEGLQGLGQLPSENAVDDFLRRLRQLFEPQPDAPVHFLSTRDRGYVFRR